LQYVITILQYAIVVKKKIAETFSAEQPAAERRSGYGSADRGAMGSYFPY
jgi:hypothetical protein